MATTEPTEPPATEAEAPTDGEELAPETEETQAAPEDERESLDADEYADEYDDEDGEPPTDGEEEEEGEEEEFQEEPDNPMDRIWDGVIKQEHLDYMDLAKEIADQNIVCKELKQYMDEKKRRTFTTVCEERELCLLQISYEEECHKLKVLMKEAIGLQFDHRDRENEQVKQTSAQEDLVAARFMRDLCSPCKKDPCKLDTKKQEDQKCKRCGASTGRKSASGTQQLEKVVKRMEKTLNSLRTNLNDMKRRQGL